MKLKGFSKPVLQFENMDRTAVEHAASLSAFLDRPETQIFPEERWAMEAGLRLLELEALNLIKDPESPVHGKPIVYLAYRCGCRKCRLAEREEETKAKNKELGYKKFPLQAEIEADQRFAARAKKWAEDSKGIETPPWELGKLLP